MLQADRELLRLLPNVKRARDFHLYLENGKRLVDLWLSGGRAVLGHKPTGVLRALKNAAERGLFTPLPHPMEKRFFKTLAAFFPERSFRLYMDEGSLFRAMAEAGFDSCYDPAFPHSKGEGKQNLSLWRPFLTPNEYTDTPVLLPVLPLLPWPLPPVVLVLEKRMEASFPPSELIPPLLLATATRSLYDLIAELKKPARRYPKIEKALGAQKSYWQRRGIYLTVTPKMDKEIYTSLFRRFLDGGFLIPPSSGEPTILPASMSQGEESALAALLAAQL